MARKQRDPLIVDDTDGSEGELIDGYRTGVRVAFNGTERFGDLSPENYEKWREIFAPLLEAFSEEAVPRGLKGGPALPEEEARAHFKVKKWAVSWDPETGELNVPKGNVPTNMGGVAGDSLIAAYLEENPDDTELADLIGPKRKPKR